VREACASSSPSRWIDARMMGRESIGLADLELLTLRIEEGLGVPVRGASR
jgi:hypothetical protein